MTPWMSAAGLLAGMAAYLAATLQVVGDDDLPARVLARARWWRRWGWLVAGACSATAVALITL